MKIQLRSVKLAFAAILCTASVWAQGDRGTITGTIADPAGAIVASASIEARNIETGAIYPTQSTNTGNYTLSQLPAGSYEISVNVPGFKKYTRQGLTVFVAQTLRIDVGLEVGSATESVTVTEAAALLKTESGELSHNVATQKLDELPVLGIGNAGAGSSSIRNPTTAVVLIPGSYNDPNTNIRVNGAPANTASFRVEGQDASNGYVPGRPAQVQPSVDAIQEVTIQTSNYAAEYGQVGGGFFNYTMRSGTNQIHGSVYDYFVNEALNAGQPFTNDGKGSLLRPKQRRNDYGFTIGGPVYLPKIYNGHDKTFFFFNFEQFREFININSQSVTVPIQAYRDGNFARALTGRSLATDPLSRTILEGAVYDPATQRAAPNGQIIRDPFAGNIIPLTRMDPVAQKVQALIPLPNSGTGLINNAIFPYRSDRITGIPAVKIDHNISSKDKLSFYFSKTYTESQYSPTLGASDGLPLPITSAIGTFDYAYVYRLNYDRTITPTLLFHMGAGYQQNYFSDDAPVLDFKPLQTLGLKGATVDRLFPAFQNMSNAQGGMKNMGPGSDRNIYYQKPTGNVSLTWVRGNHTYKTGSEVRFEGVPTLLYTATAGSYSFSATETGLPSTNGQNLGGGTVGFPYASFFLGLVNSGNIANPPRARVGQSAWGFFLQDTWKVSRKLTLDYGVRYDYQGYPREQYGRYPAFSPTTPNPTAGGRPGAVIFEGDGAGRCNCSLAQVYPYAIGPRLGGAYQLNGKTVVRVGFGIIYSGTPTNNQTTTSISIPSPFTAPAFGDPAMVLSKGIPITPSPWPNFDPGQYPLPNATTAPKFAVDQNAGRPARQYQWSIGLQREITKNLAIEAAYVANRGVWWTAPGLIDVNANTAERLKTFGLDISNAADRSLLSGRADAAAAVSRGFRLPYSAFPAGSTLAQALRPFPQFGTITYLWSPLGKTWYDSLQMKVTKRTSHGLSFTSVFTWQKSLTQGADIAPTAGTTGGTVNDVFNRQINKYISQFDQPFVFNTSLNYTTPVLKLGKGLAPSALSWAFRDWTLGAFMQYASGLPIQAPAAQNSLATLLFRGTYSNRVAGEPLFTKDLNCHCFDPGREFVLNPKAWSDPAQGTFGTSAGYYSDYRFQRRPVENLAIGRTFQIRERFRVSLRAEFNNILNRTMPNNPTSTNALATQTRTASGQTSAGFGFINTASVFKDARSGVVVARLSF